MTVSAYSPTIRVHCTELTIFSSSDCSIINNSEAEACLKKPLRSKPRWDPAIRRMREMSEPRVDVDLPIRVFGVDADDHAFSQIAHALNISNHGAKIAGVKARLKTGDIIGVHFGDKKARCRVIWVVEAGALETIEVGVKVVEGQPCPWQTEMEAQRSTGTVPISRTAPAAKDKRRFPRHRVSLQIEIQDGQASDAAMRTQTADIAGGGCYIETMLPLPVGSA
jgi:hypothetical protein